MNSVVHFEIPAESIERAKNFYSEIFGWQMEDAMPEYSLVYTTDLDKNKMPKTPGAINGGIMQKDEKDETGKFPVIVINIPNIDEYLMKIKEKGGEIVMDKINVQDMLYYARFKDLDGNIMGLVQYLKMP